MKKFLIVIVVIALITCGYVFYVEKTKYKEFILETETEKAEVSEYFIYGTSLSMKGSLTVEDISFDKLSLVLYNKDIKIGRKESIDKRFNEIELLYEINDNCINFALSKVINEGMYLDSINTGNYMMFIRGSYIEKTEDEEIISYKYYSLNNTTEYPETTYYTMSKYNKEIIINSNNDYNTIMLNVTENTNDEVYDIVIDAGHGGKDPGAVVGSEWESSYTLDIALEVKEKLANKGLKVKLTRDENSLGANEYFNEYGKGGRAQISHEVNAKYLLSIHLNQNISTSVRGVELYTPANINYDFAKTLVNNLVDNTSIVHSNRKTFKVYNGVYTHNFTESEIAKSLSDYEAKNYTAYDVTTNSSYLYMIRETGGIMTGAYVDNRNLEQTGNDYCYSNIGAEAYLLELSYLSNTTDLTIIKDEMASYTDVIANSIFEYLNK